MLPGCAPLRMKMSCRGATCGRFSAVAVDIVASVIPEGRAQVPPLQCRGSSIFTSDTKTTKMIAGSLKLGDEGVRMVFAAIASSSRLQGIDSREISGVGSAGHVSVSGGIHGNSFAGVVVPAPQISGVHQRRACGVKLRDEGVAVPGSRLQGPKGGEIGRKGVASDVCVAGGVDGNPLTDFGLAAT